MGLKKIVMRKNERGVAMVIAMLALLMLAAIGVGFMFMADTENSVTNNYRGSQVAYFAARGGAENVRLLLTPGAFLNAGATALDMPNSGDNKSAIYVVNPNASETVAGINPTTGGSGATINSNPYLDDELCLEQYANLGLTAPSGSACAGGSQLMSTGSYFTVPSTTTTQVPNTGQSDALLFKWVRITNKQNLMGVLSQAGATKYVDSSKAGNLQVCFDGTVERVIPSGQTCAAQIPQEMRPVWLLTSLAITPTVGNLPGSRRMVQMEIANWPPLFPPGSVSTQAPILLKGNLQVNGYDNCTCNCNPKTGVCTARSGMACDGSHYAVYTAGGMTQQGSATTLSSAISPAFKQNANWPYNINDLINTYKNQASNASTTSPWSYSCTGTTNLSSLPPTYQNCGTQAGQTFGTYPSGMPDSPSGSVPKTVYVPGSVHLTGNANGSGILIIDGDLDVNGGLNFYGLILVRGKVSFTGGGSQNVNLYGAILAGEDLTATDIADEDVIGGSFNFQYDACALRQIPYNGPPKLLTTHEIMY